MSLSKDVSKELMGSGEFGPWDDAPNITIRYPKKSGGLLNQSVRKDTTARPLSLTPTALPFT